MGTFWLVSLSPALIFGGSLLPTKPAWYVFTQRCPQCLLCRSRLADNKHISALTDQGIYVFVNNGFGDVVNSFPRRCSSEMFPALTTKTSQQHVRRRRKDHSISFFCLMSVFLPHRDSACVCDMFGLRWKNKDVGHSHSVSICFTVG